MAEAGKWFEVVRITARDQSPVLRRTTLEEVWRALGAEAERPGEGRLLVVEIDGYRRTRLFEGDTAAEVKAKIGEKIGVAAPAERAQGPTALVLVTGLGAVGLALWTWTRLLTWSAMMESTPPLVSLILAASIAIIFGLAAVFGSRLGTGE